VKSPFIPNHAEYIGPADSDRRCASTILAPARLLVRYFGPGAALCGHFPGNRALTKAIHSLCSMTHGECPMYSLVTGAAATGVNRSIILRAIKAGKLSAERDGSGARAIQPAEFAAPCRSRGKAVGGA